MRHLLTPDQMANWVCMMRAEVPGALLLTDDQLESRFYERCAHPDARVLTAWTAAREILRITQTRRVAGVLVAVCESRTGDEADPAIIQSSLGDTVCILLDAPSSDAALEAIAGPAWIRACRTEVGEPLLQAVSIAWVLSRLRECDGRIGAPGACTNLVDPAGFSISVAAVERKTEARTAGGIEVLAREARRLSRREMLQGASGREAAEVLAVALAHYSPRGLPAERHPEAEELVEFLRLAYDVSDLERDSVYWQMRAWEFANRPFRLVKLWRTLDPLQMLLDQRYWENDLKVFVEGCKQFSSGVSVLMLDLDNFKAVNERLGHQKGDEAIKVACAVLKDVVAGRGETYRRGGDELIAVAPGLRGEAAAHLAEEVRRGIEERFRLWCRENGELPGVTASIGVVDAAPGCDVEEVKQLLDDAQRRAKRQGKNRVVLVCCPVSPAAVA